MGHAAALINPLGWAAKKITGSNVAGVAADPAGALWRLPVDTLSNTVEGPPPKAAGFNPEVLNNPFGGNPVSPPAPISAPTPEDLATGSAMNAAAEAARRRGRAATYLTQDGLGDSNVFSRYLLAN